MTLAPEIKKAIADSVLRTKIETIATANPTPRAVALWVEANYNDVVVSDENDGAIDVCGLDHDLEQFRLRIVRG